jgi:hypothetical protein
MLIHLAGWANWKVAGPRPEIEVRLLGLPLIFAG